MARLWVVGRRATAGASNWCTNEGKNKPQQHSGCMPILLTNGCLPTSHTNFVWLMPMWHPCLTPSCRVHTTMGLCHGIVNALFGRVSHGPDQINIWLMPQMVSGSCGAIVHSFTGSVTTTGFCHDTGHQLIPFSMTGSCTTWTKSAFGQHQ